MNEDFVKKVISYKLHAANALIDRLPSKASAELKDLGRIIAQSIDENMSETKEQATKKADSPNKPNSIPID
jgi:hypothetical protein